ncbi:MAG: sigma-54 dependent transcriptional regulator [Pirellulales bacterium]|nr:sigma-54 dependent transcriptional regulator [Pirellulales bacterium]
MPKILVIDDDRTVRYLAKQALLGLNCELLEADNAETGLRLLRKEQPDVILLDIILPDLSGLEAYHKFHALDSKLPVIFMTSMESSEIAIQAMSLGAYDFVMKPLDVKLLLPLVQQALEIRRLMHVPVALPGGSGLPESADRIVGRSAVMQSVYKAIGRVAQQNVTVLIRGESGTGKELVARAIYQHSNRSDGPFLAVNCAAIPDALLESELFGHEKGSFTGADQRRIGKFEQCHGGTLFLDEIGDMSLLLQAKMLRVLQQQQFERIGGNHTITTDVRIITATNRDLEQMVEAREFRADLYYRLSGFTIHLPPLRERPADVPLLLEHFLRIYSSTLNKDVSGFSQEVRDLLQNYSWPGNIRELQNVVRQALLSTIGPVLLPEFLPSSLTRPVKNPEPSTTSGINPFKPAGSPVFHAQHATEEKPAANVDQLGSEIAHLLIQNQENVYEKALLAMERFLLTRVLEQTQGNLSHTARILGITRGSLRNKIKSASIQIDKHVKIDDLESENTLEEN